MPAILLVCTGNQCRSPVAAALLQRHVQKQASTGPWRIESAGAWAQPGRPAHPQMQQAAQQRGLDLSQHCARAIEEVPDLAQFDLVLTMERGQKEALQVEFPALRARIRLLSALAGPPYDIADPIGKAPAAYLATLHEIERLLTNGWPRLLQWLAELSPVLVPAP